MEPTIIYEDSELMVIGKPSGMTVNRADTTRHEQTLQDWVEATGKIIPPHQEGRGKSDETASPSSTYDTPETFVERAGIVHRLDKETSGIILVAKTVIAFFALQRQFKERTVKKEYLALVHGKVTPAHGEVNVPIGRQEWNRMRFGVVAGGKEAQTVYTVVTHGLLKKEPISLVRLEPKTGRTHQIRVHMKYLGYPLFGDFLYAGRKTQRDDRKYLNRVFLHAAKITFTHPTTGESKTFVSMLPPDLQGFLDTQTDILYKSE